ncbi:C45 family autoproteolytic acyltransferase/hydrolase [Rossellomorea sp. AcN35-11]|nr:C45 family peptidase [Rossellomorea aquimaris]WJV28585.1 C45 family autoproteolytic acyltransferase/hydrolase [Rossellomorea sp. AcN35-11]
MSNFNVRILQTRGSSFDIGLEIGKFFKDTPVMNSYEAITKPEIDYVNLKSIFSSISPHLLEELEGISEGVGIPFNKAAALFSGYDLPRVAAMGCSAVITNEYYVRNYDFSPFLYDGLFSLIQANNSYASAGYNLQGIGRHDGVNEHGLAVGLHFVSNMEHTKGLSAWTSIRMVLDSCSSVNEAITLLKELPHSACYNFSMGDRKGGLAVVEASPQGVITREHSDHLTCTNHFQQENHIHKNRQSIEGSIRRNNYLQGIQDAELTQAELVYKFSVKDSPLFFRDYKALFGTLHTFSYSFNEGKVVTTIAQSEQLLEIDFQDWVVGNDIAEIQMDGLIENI